MQELVNSLTEKEKEQFKDLIDEAIKNEHVIQENKKVSLTSLEQLKTNIDKLDDELKSMTEQFDLLTQAMERLSNALKPKTTEFHVKEYKE